MNDKVGELPEHGEVELLLPWYVTGKLSAADKARVEAFLATHPEMQRQLAMVRQEQELSVRANEALGQPSPELINHVMASFRQHRRAPLTTTRAWDRVAQFLVAPSAGGARWVAMAAVVLLMVQAAVIGALVLGRSLDVYGPATGPTSVAGGITLLVGFADQATAPAIAALLSEFEAQIVEGPKPGGIYRLRLASVPATEAARQEIVRRLRQRHDIVRIVLSTD